MKFMNFMKFVKLVKFMKLYFLVDDSRKMVALLWWSSTMFS